MTKPKNHMFKCLCPPKYGGPLCEGATRIVNCNNLFSFILDNTNQFFGDNFPRQWYISLISILYIYFFGKQFKGPINVMFTPRSLNFSRNERRLNRYKINNDKATASRGHRGACFLASRSLSSSWETASREERAHLPTVNMSHIAVFQQLHFSCKIWTNFYPAFDPTKIVERNFHTKIACAVNASRTRVKLQIE